MSGTSRNVGEGVNLSLRKALVMLTIPRLERMCGVSSGGSILRLQHGPQLPNLGEMYGRRLYHTCNHFTLEKLPLPMG